MPTIKHENWETGKHKTRPKFVALFAYKLKRWTKMCSLGSLSWYFSATSEICVDWKILPGSSEVHWSCKTLFCLLKNSPKKTKILNFDATSPLIGKISDNPFKEGQSKPNQCCDFLHSLVLLKDECTDWRTELLMTFIKIQRKKFFSSYFVN